MIDPPPTTTPEAAARETPGPRRPARRRADVIAAVACAAFGWLLAFAPHLIWWPRLGEPVYIADNDDVEYMAVSAQAYFNHPTRLGEPTTAGSDRSMYPAAQFVPAVVLARAFGWGPAGVDRVWRTWAGLSLGVGFYLVVRRFVAGPWVAAALASVLLADAGMMTSNPIWGQARTALLVATGRGASLFDGFPHVLPQYRIITPGLSLGALLVHVWLVARARERPDRLRTALAGASFGLLFYVYFYYWTAAGLALVLALALDAGRRRVYFHTGWLGGLIGAPAVVSNYLITRDFPKDWLLRTDNFLPIARFSELLLPRTAALLAVVLLTLTWFRRRDMLHLACLFAAGLLLLNHQVVTGLQIQNFHWTYAWGPCGSLLIVLLAAGALCPFAAGRPAAAGALAIVCLAHLATGCWLRYEEATRTTQSRGLLATYRLYRDQRRGPAAPRFPDNAVVAGDPAFTEMAIALENVRPLAQYCTLFSPYITNRELAERQALDAVLAGDDRSAFAARQERELAGGWGPWRRDPALRADRIAELLRDFDAASADPSAPLDRFRVRLVARADASPPPGPGWRLVEDGPTWRLWERPVAPAAGVNGGRPDL